MKTCANNHPSIACDDDTVCLKPDGHEEEDVQG